MKNLIKKRKEIKGKTIFLRKLNLQNATQDYCGWLNDPEVNRYLETRGTTIKELQGYIREKNKNLNCLFLGIFFKENQKHIGNIKLEPIDFKNRKATMGILIGDKDYWGRGIGTEAVRLLVDYGFKIFKLKEINLRVIYRNKAAIRVYEKVGFKVSRIKEKLIRHRQKLFDKISMSIRNKTDKNNLIVPYAKNSQIIKRRQ